MVAGAPVCPSPDLLESFVAGATPDPESASIRTHLGSCSTCRDWVDDARADLALMPSVLRALERVEPDAGGPDLGLERLARDAMPSRYRVLRRIGEGGMGIVLEAEQQQPKRRVALKILRSGSADAAAVRRFERESRVLARLAHPGIAQVLESGTFDTPHGAQPFFVMELVAGRSLDRWLSEEQPARPVRLCLFRTICAAVHHAHLRGVVHRDLKPSNVLVTADGAPKVLDFGIARAFEDESGRGTLLTSPGQIVGTLPFMSPEQVAGPSDDIDVRADVYALGVILYWLLAERLPLDLGGVTLPEAARRIHDREPTRLGTLDRTLRGDLETITAKALQKDRDRRYASAAELVDDVDRHLRVLPIAARPPGRIYTLRKFVRRNRAVVAAAVGFVVALTAGVVGTTFQANEARAAARRAIAVQRFLEDVLGSANPWPGHERLDPPGEGFTVRAALHLAAEQLEGAFPEDSAVEASLRAIIGRALHHLGERETALPHLERALTLWREVDGEELEVARLLHDLGIAAGARGDTTGGEECFRASLAIRREHLGANDLQLGYGLGALAANLTAQGRLDEAESLVQEALTLFRRSAAGEASPDVAMMLHRLAAIASDRGNAAEAERLVREALAMLQSLGLTAHPYAAEMQETLGIRLARAARLEDAESLLRVALATRRARFGEGHDQTESDRRWLSWVLVERARRARAQGDSAGAEPLAREAALVLEQPHELDGRLASRELLGVCLLDLGRDADAEPLLRWAADHRLAESGPDDSGVLAARTSLAIVLTRGGRLGAAEELWRDLLTRQGAAGTDLFAPRCGLALVLRAGGRFEAAEQMYRETLAALTPEDPRRARAHEDLGALFVDSGRYDDAERELRIALALHEQHKDAVSAAGALRDIGWCLLEAGRAAEAEASLRDALGEVGAGTATPPANAALGLRNLALAVHRQGRSAEAFELLERARAVARPGRARAIVLASMGTVLRESGRSSEALAWHERAATEAAAAFPEPQWRDALLQVEHARSLDAVGRRAEADGFLARARAVLDACLPADAPARLDAAR